MLSRQNRATPLKSHGTNPCMAFPSAPIRGIMGHDKSPTDQTRGRPGHRQLRGPCFEDGRDSVFFYRDDMPGRRLDPNHVDQKAALQRAQAFARALRD